MIEQRRSWLFGLIVLIAVSPSRSTMHVPRRMTLA
jgi:hypothetical protein